MEATNDIGESDVAVVCYRCIGEAYLSGEVKRSGRRLNCSFCKLAGRSIEIDELASRVETAFEEHYERSASGPNWMEERLQADKESDYVWTRSGTPVFDAIQCAVEVTPEIAEAILDVLADRHGVADSDYVGEESEFDGDTYYDERPLNSEAWRQAWREFERTLQAEARFFGRSAIEHLADVFGHIDKLKTWSGRSLVVQVGPKGKIKRLHRARVFQTDGELEKALCRPDLELASPPSRLARDGRMNARGISVFYGATSTGTAIAEVRPPVGSRVVVASFDIVRPLHLLDLTALEGAVDRGSIFDPSLKRRLERVAFLRTLGQHMTRPVMPNDEAVDYLATQAVADFLASTNEPLLDGIIFPSVQANRGRNVVLFQKAAKVAELDLPKGTEIGASLSYYTEDGPEVDYTVWETIPGPSHPEQSTPRVEVLSGSQYSGSGAWDDREPALKVDTTSVQVHEVSWVRFKTRSSQVNRYRDVEGNLSQELWDGDNVKPSHYRADFPRMSWRDIPIVMDLEALRGKSSVEESDAHLIRAKARAVLNSVQLRI